jgi:hypothetical protein
LVHTTAGTHAHAIVLSLASHRNGVVRPRLRLFVPPQACDVRVHATGTPEHWAEVIVRQITAASQRASCR